MKVRIFQETDIGLLQKKFEEIISEMGTFGYVLNSWQSLYKEKYGLTTITAIFWKVNE